MLGHCMVQCHGVYGGNEGWMGVRFVSIPGRFRRGAILANRQPHNVLVVYEGRGAVENGDLARRKHRLFLRLWTPRRWYSTRHGRHSGYPWLEVVLDHRR